MASIWACSCGREHRQPRARVAHPTQQLDRSKPAARQLEMSYISCPRYLLFKQHVIGELEKRKEKKEEWEDREAVELADWEKQARKRQKREEEEEKTKQDEEKRMAARLAVLEDWDRRVAQNAQKKVDEQRAAWEGVSGEDGNSLVQQEEFE